MFRLLLLFIFLLGCQGRPNRLGQELRELPQVETGEPEMLDPIAGPAEPSGPESLNGDSMGTKAPAPDVSVQPEPVPPKPVPPKPVPTEAAERIADPKIEVVDKPIDMDSTTIVSNEPAGGFGRTNGGISGGGHIRPCPSDAERVLQGHSYEGSGLTLTFIDKEFASLKTESGSETYRFTADLFCYVHLLDKQDGRKIRSFVMRVDQTSMTDKDDGNIVLKRVEEKKGSE